MAERRVLMVCMGNICRSPTAEGVLRAKLKAAGLHREVEVASAGTHGYHLGEPPDARAIRHAAARGYDLSKQRARRVVAEDFLRFDWVLAMDEDNLDRLDEIAPADSSARVGLLLEHARRFAGVREVPDPYYGAPAGFDRVLDLVEDACDGLVARLRLELGTS
jgi:protein-tyrosine phosphatase